MSSPPGDSDTLRGVETSMTLPCGPVPLLCSFRRSVFVFSRDAGCGTASVDVWAAVRAIDGVRASAEAGRTGEAAEASDECRDTFWRFGGFSVPRPPLCGTVEVDSESTFLFMPTWVVGLCCCCGWAGGGGCGGGGDN
jgi:hypothetical protein